MKKRSRIAIACLIAALLIGLLLSTQFGIKRENEVAISAPIIEVSPVLTDISNWPRWFAGAGDYRFQLIDKNPAGLTVKSERAKIQSVYTIAAYPDSLPANTRVRWTTVTSGFDWIKQKLWYTDDNPASRLAALKNYFEDPRQFYGFDIRLEPVKDSLVLTKDRMVKKTAEGAVLGQLFKEIGEFIAKAHLGINIDTCRMATFYDETQDSIHIAAGVPVSIRISPSEDGIHLLEMPAKGKMLVGLYRGPYGGLSMLYGAMRKYALDKKLAVVGAVYEKYLTPAANARDSLDMTIELHFPVL
ncbi:MAG TPA: hypothetical protein VMH27_22175 [Puia sp.]|nr:hypothetical protein [Puia sp.]